MFLKNIYKPSRRQIEFLEAREKLVLWDGIERKTTMHIEFKMTIKTQRVIQPGETIELYPTELSLIPTYGGTVIINLEGTVRENKPLTVKQPDDKAV